MVNKEKKLNKDTRLTQLTIEDMRSIAKMKGGKCLSSIYKNNKTKLEWECDKGHKWWATPSNIRNHGKWCSKCSGNARLTIEDMHQIAKERGGSCLSEKYVNNKTKLIWQCSEGHTFPSTPSSVMRGSWCPTCHIFYSEELCRTSFEQLFNEKFLKLTPKWLKSPDGFPMHLDGYCKKLEIAFEYQGHHHNNLSYFNNFDEEKLAKQKERDKLKSHLCKDNNIHLITITYKDDLRALPNLLFKKFNQIGVDVSQIDFDKKIDFNKVYQHKTKLEIIQEIAKKKGGRCLSDKYLGIEDKLTFECSKGHIWNATANSVKLQGTWCRTCGGTERLTIEDMHQIAKERGGSCLSDKYVNGKTKLNWQCAEGHKWSAVPSSIKNGTWCKTCSGTNPYTMKDMKKMAQERGGLCKSKSYSGAHSNLIWQCAEGHTWKATPNSIRRGSWCKTCSREIMAQQQRLSIDDMQKIAEKRGGKCLSTIYKNNQTKLEWECSKGHKWLAIPANIRNHGKWCPKCSGNARLTIEDMHQIAKERGGSCLSEKYVNNNTKLNWKCSEGHEWSAVPSSIKNGTWCRKCSRANVSRG